MPAPTVLKAPGVDGCGDLGQVHANQPGILGSVQDQPFVAHLVETNLVTHDQWFPWKREETINAIR